MKVVHDMASVTHSEALNRVLELVVLVNDDMTQSLARDGLTASRARVVWELGLHGAMTQKALADAIGVSARNITGLVDALVATGFVTREPHPSDRRAILVSFTEHGAKIAKELETGQKEFSHLLFDGIPIKQFDTFVDTMDEVLARLRNALSQS